MLMMLMYGRYTLDTSDFSRTYRILGVHHVGVWGVVE